jgi:23S rRNA (adenine2503-C2)-methyltransferase
MALAKKLIYDLKLEDLTTKIKSLGQPEFRAKQIWTAIYKNFKASPEEITTLPHKLREDLHDNLSFEALRPVRVLESADGLTVKTLFKLWDDYPVEAVLMYYDERRTLCISSQSGCPIGCSFCATGQMGFKRNLTSGEIIAQVLYYARVLAETEDHVTNIVVMGMGEPLLNYDHVMDALWRLNDPDAFGLGARRITISTVGIVPMIRRFANQNTQFNLAISLHTVNDELRSKLIPINKKYPVNVLLEACRYYVRKTSRRITFEIALMDGINDTIQDAQALADKLRGLICHVNLIPLNPIKGLNQKPSSASQANAFSEVLQSRNIPCTIRLRRGIEIEAGCGQLAADFENQSA